MLKFNFLKLEDFLPGYPYFSSASTQNFSNDIFDIYNDEPENVFYNKKEFYKLESSEEKPLIPGDLLQTQSNIARFLSSRTLNDELLAFQGLGSGKCIHPSSKIYVSLQDNISPFKYKTIKELWDDSTFSKLCESGVWNIPNNKCCTKSIDIDTSNIVSKNIKHIYRQLVNEELYIIYLSNNTSIKCTGKHKFLLQIYNDPIDHWVASKYLKLGDKIVVYDNEKEQFNLYYTEIIKIEKKLYVGYVYDLEVEDFHNYITNNIVTHNTCLSIATAELIKNVNPFYKSTLVLVKGNTIKRNFIKELAFKCTKGQYIPENYNSLTKGEQVARLNKLVNKKYEIRTFEKFAKELTKYSDEHIKKEFSNRPIIIDEVHNIREHNISNKNKLDVYKQVHRLLHLVNNRKILLLSATPMKDKPEEFSSIMNLILPIDMQLPSGKEFKEYYFDEDKLINIDELKNAIRGRISYLRSMESSVVKNIKGEIIRDMKKIKIYPNEMSDFQHKFYTKAYNLDIGSGKNLKNTEEDSDNEDEDSDEEEEEQKKENVQGLYDKSRQASLCVFPDGSYGSEGFKKYITQKGVNYKLNDEFKNKLTNNGTAEKSVIIENIRKYSCIYASTITEIINNPNELCFVYNKYVQGSGAILFSELLKLVGFERTRGHIDLDKNITKKKLEKQSEEEFIATTEEDILAAFENDKENEEENEEENENIDRVPRFALITGETVSDTEIDRIIDKVFNDSRNKYGKYIQVIIGSQLIGEGKSLLNVRQEHIETPHWNNAETEQALGRGIRAFSHDKLNKDERYCKVFRHAAIPLKGVESINYLMYKISEDKDFQIKQIERVCKEVAIDCQLNIKRNKLDEDIDGSAECDYMKCDYECDIQREKEENIVEKTDLFYDTYNLYYAEEELESITTIIKQLYRNKFSYDLTEILNELPDISMMIIIRALKRIIDKSIVLINKYGMVSYLKEDHNLYFLIDEITLPDSFLISYYNKNPNVKEYITFDDIIKLSQINYIQDKIYILNSLDATDDNDKEKIIKQIKGMNFQFQELFLEIAIIGEKNLKKGDNDDNDDKKEELRKIILEYFKNNIIELNDKTVSTLLVATENKYKCLIKKKETYKIEDWIECDVEKEISKIIKEKIEEKEEKNAFGYYGFIEDGKFKIKVTGGNNVDKRKNARGYVCITKVPPDDLYNIIVKLNIKPSQDELDNIEEDKDIMIKKILKKYKTVDKSELKSMSDNKLKMIYYWVHKAKKNVCEGIQEFFEKNNNMMDVDVNIEKPKKLKIKN